MADLPNTRRKERPKSEKTSGEDTFLRWIQIRICPSTHSQGRPTEKPREKPTDDYGLDILRKSSAHGEESEEWDCDEVDGSPSKSLAGWGSDHGSEA